MNIGFPQFNVPPIDVSNGQWNRAWYLFLQDLWVRSGGAQGQSVSEIITDLADDAGLEELKVDVYNARDAANLAPPIIPNISQDDQAPPGAFFSPSEDPNARFEALEAAVFQLITEINALKQGAQP